MVSMIIPKLISTMFIAGVMFSSPTRWCWNPSEGADGYRLYWVDVALQEQWEDTDEDGVVDTLRMVVPMGDPGWKECQRWQVTGTCTTNDASNPATDHMTMLTVTAFNVGGESGTGDDSPGTPDWPVQPCP